MDKKKPVPAMNYMCGFAIFLIILSCISFSGWPFLMEQIIKSQLVLKPGGELMEFWKQIPFPVDIDFYFFNWTNPEQIREPDVKMKFKEMGPYRFSEMKAKTNITWNNNGTITFRRKHTWFALEEEKYKLQDLLTTIDPLAVTASYMTRNWNYLLRKALSITISGSRKIHTTKTISQLLFEGYEDPFITLSKTLPIAGKMNLPPWDRFGWFYTRNNSETYDGVFNMGTGENSEFGHLYSWNYENHTRYYEGECGKVTGSAGELYTAHPPKDRISLFSSDMCRPLYLDYVGEAIVSNILGYKYELKSALDNGTLYPENQCYCVGECVRSGVFNISACRWGSPGFGSLPHFFNADPYYVDSVEGMNPDPEKHKFYMVLEATTGVPLEVHARLQINLLLQKVPGISLFDHPNIKTTFVPVLWFEQKVSIPQDLASRLRILLNLPVMCTALGILCLIGGLILISCAIYRICTTNLCGRPKEKFIGNIEQHIPLNMENIKGEIVKRR